MSEQTDKLVYKKTYKPLIIWMVMIIVVEVGGILILSNFTHNNRIETKVSLLIIMLMLDLLFYIVYKGQYVYWINGGPSYEIAKNEDPERRKKFAWLHLKLFLQASVIFVLYVIISYLLQWGFLYDVLVFALLVIVQAIRSIRIKF